jgi:CBS domain-containing protein
VVSQRDLLRASLSTVMGLPREERSSFLDGVTIAEVMSVPPLSVAPDTPVRKAAGMMAERKVGCLPVVEDERVIGIVTETDVLRWVASESA